MTQSTTYEAEIEFHTEDDAGEEVTYTIGVTHYYRQLPNPYADSDTDFYGYEEVEWDLLDKDDKPVPTPDEWKDRIERVILDYFEEVENDI